MINVVSLLCLVIVTYMVLTDTEQVQEAVSKLKLGKSDDISEIYSNGIIMALNVCFVTFLCCLLACLDMVVLVQIFVKINITY